MVLIDVCINNTGIDLVPGAFSSYENEERKRVGICSPTQKRHFQLLKMTPYSKNVRLLLLSVLFGTDNLMLAVFDNCLKSFL